VPECGFAVSDRERIVRSRSVSRSAHRPLTVAHGKTALGHVSGSWADRERTVGGPCATVSAP